MVEISVIRKLCFDTYNNYAEFEMEDYINLQLKNGDILSGEIKDIFEDSLVILDETDKLKKVNFNEIENYL